MPIYRVTFQTQAEGHAGYGYYGSRRKAEKQVARWKRERAEDDADAEIEPFPTPVGKEAWIKLLNAWGSHPDNG